MATITHVSNSARIQIYDGTDSSGNAKYVNTSFPRLDVDADPDKIIAVASSFENLAQDNIYSIMNTIVDYIS